VGAKEWRKVLPKRKALSFYPCRFTVGGVSCNSQIIPKWSKKVKHYKIYATDENGQEVTKLLLTDMAYEEVLRAYGRCEEVVPESVETPLLVSDGANTTLIYGDDIKVVPLI